MKSKIVVLYHFYYPDDVVSARLYQDLCEDLVRMNWEVEAWPANRSCHEVDAYSALEKHEGVQINRIWRPGFSQARALGRVVNSLWMIAAWILRWVFLPRHLRPKYILIGSDPVLALAAALGIRFFDKDVKIAHWCFDLYPEAAAADGKISESGVLYRTIRRMMIRAYKACDAVVDIGSCMRNKILNYGSIATKSTLTPWALDEVNEIQEPDVGEREKLFGNSKLTLLYPGSFGLAHTADLILKLAEEMKSDDVRFCFSVRGNAVEQLKSKCAKKNIPVVFAGFVEEGKLRARLGAADIHIVSLKETWTGTVVPSKFFSAIAAGRPVLFEGSEDSAIAKWIREYQVGWVLSETTFDSVAADLRRLATHRDELQELQGHCYKVYQAHFSRKIMVGRWNQILQELM